MSANNHQYSKVYYVDCRRMEKQDLEAGIWTVPKEKSKTKITRPLGLKALALINWQLETFGGFSDYVPPSGNYKNPISSQTVNKMCRAYAKDEY